MRTDSLRNVALILATTGLTFACASGEAEDDVGTFTTADPTTTTNGNESETRGDEESDTSHSDESDTSSMGETCDDGVQNQGETDVDCGGPNCAACGDGQSCSIDSDCALMSCVGGLCITPSCMDGVANGDETDVDCGGPSCSPCDPGLGCAAPSDCLSGVCSGNFCAAPNCGDAVQNGNETDVDCGGDTCEGCLENEMCAGDSDCLSQYCVDSLCAPADCLVDADCAAFDGECTMGSCTPDHTCEAVAINEGNPCDDGDLCSTSETCSAGSCGGGAPVDCSNLSNACNVGVCNPDDGMCVVQSANEGNPCNDDNACTIAEVCTLGQCEDPNDPGYIFYEDFADNSAGWTFGTNWSIGSASASACSSCPGNDPSSDHTATADNGIAGVLIGGCTPKVVHGDYCLTSPVVNTTGLGTVWLTYWRHLHADYSPYMVSKVQVYDGAAWQQVWTTGGSPCTNDNAWTQMAHNVTAYSNAAFRVRFCYSIGSTSVFESGSWNLDDVTIAPAQCTP